MADKSTYYLLSGEGEAGTWTGPYLTTERGARMRASRERRGGRWCRAWQLCPETASMRACVQDVDNGDLRDVPTVGTREA